jgi:hypothetical protein
MILLNDLITSYPSFQANQVLTREALNNLANYLEQQNRLTRQKLIGIGIVCGLDVNLTNNDDNITITITKGVGLTSEGYLICLDTSNCTHKRLFKNKASYPFFINPNTDPPITYSIWEILPNPGETNDETIIPLTDADINDKIVVLYLEILENSINKCLDENCDEKGKRWDFIIRKLLINRTDMKAILEQNYDLGGKTLDEYFNPAYSLPDVYLERLTNLNLSSLDDLIQAYKGIINSGGLKLTEAFKKLYELYKPLFDLQLASNSDPFSDFNLQKIVDIIDKSESSLSVQYFYDFLLDLIATYQELVEKLLKLNSECSPNPNLFPRHLMLGELQANNIGQFSPSRYSLPTVFRHYFTSAPIYNDGSDLWLNVKQLIQRLISQINSFDYDTSFVNGDTKIKITPTLDCSSPLGKQAIPFYYLLEKGGRVLWQDWDFETSKRNWANRILGYHAREDTSNERITNPLKYDICKYPKLRIEGHVGKGLAEAIDTLTKLKQENNLNFDIIALKLDNDNSNQFYLADTSKIADLQALYLIERNDLVCCLRDIIKLLEQSKGTISSVIYFILYYSFYYGRQTQNGIITPAYNAFNKFYSLYLDSLKNYLLEELPINLQDFDINDFEDAYNLVNSMSLLIKYFIDTWNDVDLLLIRDPRQEQETDQKKEVIILSDLLSLILNAFELFLDKILDDCLQARFATIYNLFSERVKNFSLFSRFTKKISGIEHIAGTNKDGTFILVYEQSRTRIIEGNVIDNQGKAIAIRGLKVMIPFRKTSFVLTDDKGKFRINIPNGIKQLIFTKVGYKVQTIQLEEKTNDVDIPMIPLTPLDKDLTNQGQVNFPVLVNDFENLVNDIKEISNLGKVSEKINLNVFEKERIKIIDFIDFSEDEQFRVVADFYLPCTLPNHQLEITLQEVCPDDGKEKLTDLQKIVKELVDRIGKDELQSIRTISEIIYKR